MKITYQKDDNVYDCYLAEQESEFHLSGDIATTKRDFLGRLERMFDEAMMKCVKEQLRNN